MKKPELHEKGELRESGGKLAVTGEARAPHDQVYTLNLDKVGGEKIRSVDAIKAPEQITRSSGTRCESHTSLQD